MRVGVQDGSIAGRPTVDALTRAAYWGAVTSGADSFWVPDHLNSLFPRALWQPKYFGGAKAMPSADAHLEPWTMLGHIAARNRLARLRLGVAVTDAGRRNPAVTAQAAATLHLLTKGRAIVGIGTGEREGNEPYGVEWSKPVARFEEAMATIRALFDSNGQLVNRDSSYFPLRQALFDLPSYKGTRPQLWIAAHGPRMLRAVGRYADGFLPASIYSPQEYANSLDAVRSAASDAGRDPMSIVPALWAVVVTGPSRAHVDEALESELIKSIGLSAPDAVFARHGVHHPLGVGFTGAQDILPQEFDEATALAHVKNVPAALIRETTLSGTLDEVRDRAAVWRDHGVRYLVLANIGSMQRSARGGLRAIASFSAAVRQIKKL